MTLLIVDVYSLLTFEHGDPAEEDPNGTVIERIQKRDLHEQSANDGDHSLFKLSDIFYQKEEEPEKQGRADQASVDKHLQIGVVRHPCKLVIHTSQTVAEER